MKQTNTSILLKPCVPPWWATNGQLQTIFAYFLPSRTRLQNLKTVIIPLEDGDHLYGELSEGVTPWIIYLFHGLSGDINSNYMQRAAFLAQLMGHSIFLVNHRDCGKGSGLARHPYHSGRGEDISEVLDFGKKQFPNKKHLVIGFSLSGNALLTLLTGKRGSTQPDRAICVNAPINLNAASEKLTQGFNRLYDIHFVWRLKQTVQHKIDRGEMAAVHIPLLATLRDFDELYTAPYGGFTDRAHYYESCSTDIHLSKISVPTFLLTAKDDPFVPVESYEKADFSSSTTVHIENVGGHLGYLSNDLSHAKNKRWLDYALGEVLKIYTTLD